MRHVSAQVGGRKAHSATTSNGCGRIRRLEYLIVVAAGDDFRTAIYPYPIPLGHAGSNLKCELRMTPKIYASVEFTIVSTDASRRLYHAIHCTGLYMTYCIPEIAAG